VNCLATLQFDGRVGAKKKTHLPVWAFSGLRNDSQESDESVICRLCNAISLVRGRNAYYKSVQPSEKPLI